MGRSWPGASRARIRYELTGDGDGPTDVRLHERVPPARGRLGSVASRCIVGATSEREAHNSLARLKALLERT